MISLGALNDGSPHVLVISASATHARIAREKGSPDGPQDVPGRHSGGADRVRGCFAGPISRDLAQDTIRVAGALVAARVRRLVFAARDLRFGGVRSKFRIADSDLLNHQVEVVEGVLGADVTKLMQKFFAGRR